MCEEEYTIERIIKLDKMGDRIVIKKWMERKKWERRGRGKYVGNG